MLNDDNGELTGFEIPNNFISSKSIASFIEKATGATIVAVRKMFDASEIHVNFVFENTEFEVWEPFGDNSRLHIGPKEKAKTETIKTLEQMISTY